MEKPTMEQPTMEKHTVEIFTLQKLCCNFGNTKSRPLVHVISTLEVHDACGLWYVYVYLYVCACVCVQVCMFEYVCACVSK